MGPLDLVNMCEWACLGAFTVLLKTSTDAFDGQPRVHIALLGPTHLLVPRSPHNDDAVVLHTAFDLTGKQDGKLQECCIYSTMLRKKQPCGQVTIR
mmetsp:Transcript_5134/g.7524  ORF Transcript_5134/g.7524 Transcript_5134/m.7524 type:complete len:96 (+) Transcript_5134:2-289(+)